MISYSELFNLNLSWRELAARDARLFKKGHRLVQTRDLFFILKGRISLQANTSCGKERIIWFLRDNSIFNEVPIVSRLNDFCLGTWTCSIIEPAFSHVCMRDTLVGRLPFDLVLEEGKRRPELLLNLCSSLALKVALLAQKNIIDNLACPRERVFYYVDQLRRLHKTDERICFEATFQDVANLLGIHRISLYKILDQARREGIMDYSRKQKFVTILDRAAFDREARGQ